MPTPSEALVALRRAGFQPDDPDAVKLFNIEEPGYIAKAKAAKPHLFGLGDHGVAAGFDARTAPAEDVDRELRKLTHAAPARRHAQARTASTMAALAAEYGR